MATFNVNTTSDIVDANDGVLSLREAIIAAEATAGRDTINLSGFVNLENPLLINAGNDLDISGNGRFTGIDGNNQTQLLLINGAEVRFDNLSLTEGRAQGGLGLRGAGGGGGGGTGAGGFVNDTLELGIDNDIDTVIYRNGDGSDVVNHFTHGVGGDLLSFEGIEAIDVVVNDSSTFFHLGDGVEGNAGFGSGQLLVELSDLTGFTAETISQNLSASNTAELLFA